MNDVHVAFSAALSKALPHTKAVPLAKAITPPDIELKARPQNGENQAFADIMASLGPSEMVNKRPDIMEEMIRAKESLTGDALSFLRAAEKYESGMKFGNAMKKALDTMKGAFRDFGIPVIDHVRITRSPDGTFHVSGWGKGVGISHPQKKFIEDALNNAHPKLEALHNKLMKQINTMESAFSIFQDEQANFAKMEGADFEPSNSIFDNALIFGNEFPEMDKARKMTWANPDGYQAFKDSLGTELEKMGSESQILSRYYYHTVTLPGLPDSLRAFL